MMIYWLHTLEIREAHKARGPNWLVSFASYVEAAWFGMMLLSCLPGERGCLDQQRLKCAGKRNLQDTGITKLKGKQKADQETSVDC